MDQDSYENWTQVHSLARAIITIMNISAMLFFAGICIHYQNRLLLLVTHSGSCFLTTMKVKIKRAKWWFLNQTRVGQYTNIIKQTNGKLLLWLPHFVG